MILMPTEKHNGRMPNLRLFAAAWDLQDVFRISVSSIRNMGT